MIKRKNYLKLLVVGVSLMIGTANLGLVSCDKPIIECTVTFKSGAEVFETKKVEKGQAVSKPINSPSKDDYEFKGWYVNLHEDGSGKDDPFDFATIINEDLTLHAGFEIAAIEPDNKITAFLWEEGYTFDFDAEIVFNDMEYHLYDNRTVASLTKDNTPFEIPENLAFQDITSWDGVDCYETEDGSSTYYLYNNEDLEISYYYEVFETGFISANFTQYGDESLDFSYFVYDGAILCKYTINESEDFQVIIQKGEVSQLYNFNGWIPLEDNQTLDQDFRDQYVHNGVVWFDSGHILKEQYLYAYFSDKEDVNGYFIIEEGETYTLPEPYGSNPDTAYRYNTFTLTPLNELDFSVLELSDFVGIDYLLENCPERDYSVVDGVTYYYTVDDNEVNYVHFYLEVDEKKHEFELYFTNGVCTASTYNFTNGIISFDVYDLVIDEDYNVIRAYLAKSETVISNTFMITSIAPYKDLNTPIYIDILAA